MIGFDPLLTGFYGVLRYRRRNSESKAWNEDCDCGRPEGARHHSLCSVSPIYAAMCSQFGIPRIEYLPLQVLSMTVSRPLLPPLPTACTCEPAVRGSYSGALSSDCPVHVDSNRPWLSRMATGLAGTRSSVSYGRI